jgi:hypothetical protein
MSATDICVTSGYGIYPLPPGHSANWTAGYGKGTTSITLSSTTGLAAGDLLVLDQLNDPDTDTGNVWVCSTTNVCSSEGDSEVRRPNRSQSQVVVVTSCSPSCNTAGTTTVNFTPGLYMPNWVAAKSPGAWWDGAHSVSGIGIEDMSLDHSSSPAISGFQITGARDWWIKNIRSVGANRSHIWVYGATRGTIRDSYLFGSQNGSVSGSQSYGVETDIASDLLIENNIGQAIAGPFPAGESVTGVVYGYNYGINDLYASSGNTQWMQGMAYHHSSGISYHLFEGNDGPGFTADQIHGTSNFGTLFRNHFVGWESGKTQQTIPVHIYSFNRYFNVIGNVLGNVGTHTNYEGGPASTTTLGPDAYHDISIYMLGWSGNQQKYDTANGDVASMPNDPLVKVTLMRWGNYDVVTAVPQWNASEVPSGLNPYGNPVPSNNSLPPSFYLSAKPAFWGSGAWPAIGPDVSGGAVPNVGGHVNKIPARLCFENIMGGTFSSGLLTFNANRCYYAVSAPATPTNLRIIP